MKWLENRSRPQTCIVGARSPIRSQISLRSLRLIDASIRMARLLSSRWTFLMKYVLPPLWITGAGAVTALLFYTPEHFLSQSGDPPPPIVDYLFLGMWVVGSIIILLTTMPLKRVHLDGNRLIVSNFRRESRIPLSDIATVRQNLWTNIRPITIAFRNRTPFGRKIQFMPTTRVRFWVEDPVVDELRTLSIPRESPQQYASASPPFGVPAQRLAGRQKS